MEVTESQRPRLSTIPSSTIWDILDEIDDREKKHAETTNASNDWNKIIKEGICNDNIEFIEHLISNDFDINSQNPVDGKTLLIYASVIGKFNLIQLLLDFDAKVHIKDNDGLTAIDYTIRYEHYKLALLLHCQQVSKSPLRNNVKDIAIAIADKNKEAELIGNFYFTYNNSDVSLSVGITQFIINALKQRAEFSKDLLYYAFYFMLKEPEPMKSPLWIEIIATIEQILANISDRHEWNWFNKYILNSYFWYMPHPVCKHMKNKSDSDMEGIVTQTVFKELFVRVKKELRKISGPFSDQKLNVITENKSTTNALRRMGSEGISVTNLFSIENKCKIVHNIGMLIQKLKVPFNVIGNTSMKDVINKLVHNDDLKYFQLLWNLIGSDYQILIGSCDKNMWKCTLVNIIHKNGEINDYLEHDGGIFHYEANILNYIQTYCETYGMRTMIDCINISRTFMYKMFKIICKQNKYEKLLEFILYQSPLNDKHIIKLIDSTITQTISISTAAKLIKFFKKDRKMLLKLLYSIDKCKNTLWINICSDYSKHGIFIINFIFENPMISKYDIIQLFNFKDKHGRTALHAAFMASDDYYSDNMMPYLLEWFQTRSKYLVKLLLQKTGPYDKVKHCILNCTRQCDMQTIFEVLKNDKIIWKLLSQVNMDDFDADVFDIISEWKDYLKLEKWLNNTKNGSTDFCLQDYDTNPWMTACKNGKVKTIKKLIKKKVHSKEDLIQLLCESDSNKETALMKIACCKYNSIKLLKWLLLNNSMFCDKDKVFLLLQKDIEGKNVLMKSMNYCRLLILKHFGKKEKYLRKILTETDYKQKQLLYYISLSNDNQSFKYIFYSCNLNDKHKMQLIQNKDISSMSILNYLQNDLKYFQKLLCAGVTKKVLFDSIQQNDTENALHMINYLKRNEKEWIKTLSKHENGTTCLMCAAQNDTNGMIIKEILQSVVGMKKQLQLTLLKFKDRENESFMFKLQSAIQMKIVLSILDNKIIKHLLCDTNKKGCNVYKHMRNNNKDFEMEILISQCMQYLEFDRKLQKGIDTQIDLLFHNYNSNPFLYACCLGKYETINMLLCHIKSNSNNAKDVKAKMKLLFLKNYNKENGNNCTMELIENGYYNALIQMLDFLDSNNLSDIKMKLLSMQNVYSKKSCTYYIQNLSDRKVNRQIINKIIKHISQPVTVKKVQTPVKKRVKKSVKKSVKKQKSVTFAL